MKTFDEAKTPGMPFATIIVAISMPNQVIRMLTMSNDNT